MGAALLPIGLVAGIAGAGLNAVGTYNSMQAQSANAAYQSQVASNNATIAGRNANMDLQAGVAAETNRGLKTRAQVGAALAGQGASGVDVNSRRAVCRRDPRRAGPRRRPAGKSRHPHVWASPEHRRRDQCGCDLG